MSFFPIKKKKKKALVIGLDGVPFSLINSYLEKGILPNCGGILTNGFSLNQMDVSIPDVSSTSWASFMTGVNPGEHGIFGFMDLKPGTYQLFFPNSHNIKAPTIWELIGGTQGEKHSSLQARYKDSINGKYRSIILNIPQTYPASPINGVLTAGFVAPDLKKATYPESAYEYLQSIGYVTDVDSSIAIESRKKFFDDIFAALEKRERAFQHFFKNEKWDLTIATITETDRLHHFFFDAALDGDKPYHETFVSFYRELDRFIAKIYRNFMEMTDGNGLFMTMSDHGFTPIEKEVYLNAWLHQMGYLTLKRDRDYFEQIGAGTKAFALDPSRIYIHVEGKYPQGTVKSADKELVIGELRDVLKSLKDIDGKEIIKDIYGNGELYRGPYSEMGPDLVCLPNDGYDLKGRISEQEVFGRKHFTGMHTRHDAHCILPLNIETEERIHIEHLAGYILDYFTS
jgi:predicted AlkP superfamily phosphohydrolase/phosphomutase